VFSDLAPAEIARATPQTVGAWDSLANVTLIAVIEEEFGKEIPLDQLESLSSFAALKEFLER
jgi:acyl carrier protein